MMSHMAKYPDDLRALLLASDLTAQSVIYPPKRAPSFTSAEADAEWAQANSDYVYLGGGLNDSVWADIILAHENPARTGSPDNVGVAYADGSVAFLPPVAFEKALLRHSIYRSELERPN